jgi:HEAT repeat protein
MVRVGVTALLGLVLLQPGPNPEPMEKTDEEILKEARLPVEPAGLVKHLRGLVPSSEQRQRAAALVEQLGDPVYAKREAAEEALAKMLPGAVAVLRPALRSPDPEIADRARVLLQGAEKDGLGTQWRAAVRVLAKQPPPGLVETLLAVLPLCFDDATEEEILTVLVRLAGKGDKLPDVVVSALEDTDPARRAASALLLGRGGSAEQRKKVQALLTDPVLEVRLRAGQGLVAARDRAGLAVLVQAIREGTPGQARQASDLLLALAGPGAPGSLEVGTPAQRATLARSWEAWLQGVGRQVDLSRVEVEFGALNRTIAAVQVTRKFIAAAEFNNTPVLKPLIGLPYVHLENQVATTNQELDNVLSQGLPQPPRSEVLPTTRIPTLDALMRSSSQGARVVGSKHPREEIVAVESTYRFPNQPNATRVTVYVRVPKAGGPAKVVGYAYINFDIRRPPPM